MPEKARWDFLKANATSTDPTIGALIDQAMIDLEAAAVLEARSANGRTEWKVRATRQSYKDRRSAQIT